MGNAFVEIGIKVLHTFYSDSNPSRFNLWLLWKNDINLIYLSVFNLMS